MSAAPNCPWLSRVPRGAKVTNEESTPGARSSERFAAQAEIGWLAADSEDLCLRDKWPLAEESLTERAAIAQPRREPKR